MITIYSNDTCASCHQIKNHFDRKLTQGDTKYIYRVFNADEEPHRTQLSKLTPQRILPTLIINGKIIQGPNYTAINKALEII